MYRRVVYDMFRYDERFGIAFYTVLDSDTIRRKL